MEIVVFLDTSVINKWYLDETAKDLAINLITQGNLHTLDFAEIELLNTLTKKYRRKTFSSKAVQQSWHQWRNLNLNGTIHLTSAARYFDAALALSLEHQHPFPDMLFIAAAKNLRMRLITADRGQAEKAKACGVDVELVRD